MQLLTGLAEETDRLEWGRRQALVHTLQGQVRRVQVKGVGKV